MIKQFALISCAAIALAACEDMPKTLKGEAAENVLAMCIMLSNDVVSFENVTVKSLNDASVACARVEDIDTSILGKSGKECVQSFVDSADMFNEAAISLGAEDAAQAHEIISEISKNECLA